MERRSDGTARSEQRSLCLHCVRCCGLRPVLSVARLLMSSFSSREKSRSMSEWVAKRLYDGVASPDFSAFLQVA